MDAPHLHHILYVNGRSGAERGLVSEGHRILREVGIDPLKGTENLVWAPNKGHTLAETRALVERLRLERGSETGVTKVLKQFGRKAESR
jgi:hypothetical protein